ncbi:MAG: hypothetical protein M1825_005171 [Sarcosagium campestre]|nr:MAG: hypothetical protein M1825_005171 [Sarcosagium campestre]
MGVTGLWTVVQPCARPIKIETLNKKRLAVDASIWIYQFLKAVRDKEGNALRNSHVVGFFRRICKLLFFGIKPVFVFDGGAPALKRQTIAGRKQRREGRRDDAVRTAGKLLAVQMQRRAEEDAERRKREKYRPIQEDAEEEEVPDNPVYVDELQMTQQERQANRTFRKKDQYHLPDLDVSLDNMGAPDDPRIMSHEELEQYAQQFHSGEDINLYDFSKIDFDSPFFISLPASDRYNILNAARLRSRLRMGYSKDQLDTMFPDRMAFSKFQIERVTERNELTQRLMNLNGMNGDDDSFGSNAIGRVAGERSREYVLVKNDGVDGGWALGVVSNNKDEGERNRPIDVEKLDAQVKAESDEENEDDDDGGFEDVPIEGLNRLPKRKRPDAEATNAESLQDEDETNDLRQALNESGRDAAESTVRRERNKQEADSLFVAQDEDRQRENELFGESEDDEQAELDRAIALSLEDPLLDDFAEAADVDQDKSALTTGPDPDDSDDDMDIQAALSRSRNTEQPSRRNAQAEIPKQAESTIRNSPVQQKSLHASLFDGPLPFERLDFGKSLLGARKSKAKEDDEGGFEKASGATLLPEKKKAQPLPPWFSSDVKKDSKAQQAIEERQREGDDAEADIAVPEKRVLNRQETGEVIDLQSDGNESDDDVEMVEVKPVDSEIRMGDVADLVRAEPPMSSLDPIPAKPKKMVEESDPNSDNPQSTDDEPFEWDESDEEQGSPDKPDAPTVDLPIGEESPSPPGSPSPEFEDVVPRVSKDVPPANTFVASKSKSPSPVFDVGIAPAGQNSETEIGSDRDIEIPHLVPEDSFDPTEPNIGGNENDDDDFSDPEDDELIRQLAIEAEEHARFASELNKKPQMQNQEDYERELRGLRNQQKKDRRDADEVSHIMVTECQQLLQLFGLPYITAPMEAEAQCAELVRLGLVDGIVTDDSDCFLFGGTRIYKNMFNQAKFVECYLASDLEKEFDLDRLKLIRAAHLLGSDYTEGIPTVGPVTALEILSEFNSDSALEDFRDWWQTVQSGRDKDNERDKTSAFRRKFRRNAARIFLPPSFPVAAVTDAYLHPEVDSSRDQFQWGVPDLDALRSFLMATIGWSQERTDEVLVPVIRDMNRRDVEGTQSNLTAYFTGEGGAQAYAPRRRDEGLGKRSGKIASRRLEGALGKLANGAKRKRGENGQLASDASAPVAAAAGAPSASSKVTRRIDRSSSERVSGGDNNENGEDNDDDDDDDEGGVVRHKSKRNSARRSVKGKGKGKARS